MRYSTLVLALVASLPKCLAFSETFPVVAWSSHRNSALDHLRFISATPNSTDVFGKLLFEYDVCQYDAVITVDQPGLHASDLRALAPSSTIATRLQDSPSSVQLPYVLPAPGADSIHHLADKLAQRCGAQRVNLPIAAANSAAAETLDSGSKHVLCMSMPAVTESAGARKRSVVEHEARLAIELEKFERAFPRHLVIFAGSRRQDDSAPPPTSAPSSPAGGILARYQLLTPALIVGLLLAFFVLIPIILFGISALASIESPLRVQPPKGFSADEKKNQ
ncbi:hypothetical protein BGW80DRAFT_1435790 [Lactifluus volemus]|nr:hypothetical protein BGW80DRAFT_1435790 [Lactifluus volemus]